MPRDRRYLSRPVLAWAAAGLLISLGAEVLLESFWLRGVVPAALWLLIGIGLVARRLWAARRPAARSEALAEAGFVVFVGLLVAVVSPFLAEIGSAAIGRFRFERNRPLFEAIVAEVGATRPPPGRHERAGVVYYVDDGAPLRVAFPWPSGTVFSWCGAVYDPSGAVMRAGSPGTSDDDLATLFGGGLTDCRALGERYYVCCFNRE